MKKYVSIDDIINNENYPFTKGQFRGLIAQRKTNGLFTCVRKIGRRVYIREDLFIEWIENQAEDFIKSDYVVTESHKISIEELDFSVRTLNCLKFAKIKYLQQLVEKTESELLSIKNMGKRSLNEIKDKLIAYGSILREE